MLYESDDEENKIDLLYSKPTDEKNGVKVIVPVKYSDRKTFYEKIKEQLAYFQNVYFDVQYGNGVANDFSIFRSDDFQISELCSDNNLHICLEDVYYSIDYQKLGINTINIPVAIRFSLTDGIIPTPNREQIKYTEHAKNLIISKIRKISDWFINEYNKKFYEIENVEKLFEFYANYVRIVEIAKRTIKIDNLKSYSAIKINEPKLKGVEILNVAHVYANRGALLQEYKKVLRFYRRQANESIYDDTVKYNDLENCYIISENFVKSGKKARYFKDEVVKQRYTEYFLIKRKKPFKLFKGDVDNPSLYRILGLKLIPRDKWRAAIKEFYMMRDQIVSKIPAYDSFVPTQSWLDIYYPKMIKGTNGRMVKPKGAITLKIGSPLEKYTGNNCKFVSTNYLLQDIHKNKGLIVVSTDKDSSKLDDIYFRLHHSRVDRSVKHQVAIVSDREYENIKKYGIHNLITLDKFMEGDCKPFRRIVTGIVIHKLKEQYRRCFVNPETFDGVITDLKNQIEEMSKYEYEFYRGEGNAQALLEVAESRNLWDEPAYTKYLKLKQFLEAHPLLNYFADKYSDQMTKVALKDYLRHHKIKMDAECYKSETV